MYNYLGGKKRPFDFRDIKLGAIQPAVSLPDTYMTDVSNVAKHWQNGYPECGPFATTHLQEILLGGNLSPRYMSVKCNLGQTLAQAQSGTNVRTIAKVLQSSGICDQNLLPDTTSVNLAEYIDPKVITPEMDANAELKIIKNYAFLNSGFTFHDLQQAIYQNKAILLLTYVDDGFFRTVNPTFTTKKWGHFIDGIGYTPNGIWILDSTESDFSLSVKFIKKEYVEQGFVWEGMSVVELPAGYVNNFLTLKILCQKVIELLRQEIKLKVA